MKSFFINAKFSFTADLFSKLKYLSKKSPLQVSTLHELEQARITLELVHDEIKFKSNAVILPDLLPGVI